MKKYKRLNTKNKTQNGKENLVFPFGEFLYEQKFNTNIAHKVYSWWNKDYMRGLFITQNGKWYYEISNYNNMPMYVFNYINRYMKSVYNANYLYDDENVFLILIFFKISLSMFFAYDNIKI